MTSLSAQWNARARKVSPGGVQSPVRAFKYVGGEPVVMERGTGPYMFDVDGRRYVDYMLSWGPLLHGHAHPAVVEAAQAALVRGSSFGATSPAEIELCEELCQRVPGLERVRLVSSGTEAAMSALRLARAATGRMGIVKFEGCYHGHADALLVAAGSGAATLGVPSSPGTVGTKYTRVLPYNDAAALRALFETEGASIAAVIVEPVAGNMGLVAPTPEFLQALLQAPRAAGALLVVDEVMTGFRVDLRSAVGLYGIDADLIVLGKVVGGGFPLAAYGGRAELMSRMAPEGPVYQAGTLSGNPVAAAAGLANVRLTTPEAFAHMGALGERLVRGLTRVALECGVAAQVERIGAMGGLFFAPKRVENFAQAKVADHGLYARFFHEMLNEGVYFPPAGYEAWFLSSAHTEADIDFTIAAAQRALPRALGGAKG